MMRKVLLVACIAVVALLAPTDAACKAKSSETTAPVAAPTTTTANNTSVNKIQAAPTDRMKNKLLFDVVPKKQAKSDDKYDDDE